MDKETLVELQMIKKLLMYQIVVSGATSKDLAAVLGIDDSTVRKMLPMRKLKKSR